MNKSLKYIDAFKGILIILVVLGHSSFHFKDIIFWFHMPVFIMISGYLEKYNEQKNSNSINKLFISIFKFFIPYISYFVVITFLIFLTGLSTFTLTNLFIRIKRFIIGGTYLFGEYGVFWFITTLFLSKTLFMLLKFINTNKKMTAIYALFAFIIALNLNNEGKRTYEILNPWWSLRYLMIGTFYFSLGYYFKKYERIIESNQLKIASFFIICLMLVMQLTGFVNYKVNMKYGYNSNYILDLVLPSSFFIVIYWFTKKLSMSKIFTWLQLIGRHTLPIMYFHIVINMIIFRQKETAWIIYTLVGVSLPLAVSLFVLNKTSLARKLFLKP